MGFALAAGLEGGGVLVTGAMFRSISSGTTHATRSRPGRPDVELEVL